MVKIQRFDPTINKKPYYQKYKIPMTFGLSVSNVLDFIYNNIDSSIAYYANCHKNICGRCGVHVNGVNKLACTELVTGNITLEPLPHRIVIRDLVVEGA